MRLCFPSWRGNLLKFERKIQALYLWLGYFLACALSFLQYHFLTRHKIKCHLREREREKRKAEDKKPFKAVAGTESDVRSSPSGFAVTLKDSHVSDVMLTDHGRIYLCHL